MWSENRRPVVAVLLFDDVEVLDFAGPYEVFVAARNSGGERRVDVMTVAETQEIVCTGGLRVHADVLLDGCPRLDLLVVPGGGGARDKRPQTQDRPIEFIASRVAEVETLGSVCTGAFLLGRAGLLDGKIATTHTRRLELFQSEFPSIDVVAEKIVDLGEVVTAAGVSSGVDLALHMLDRWFGPEVRAESAALLDGPWS